MSIKTTVSLAAGALALSLAAETLPNWTLTWTNDAHTAGVVANDRNALVVRVWRGTTYNGFGLVVGCQTGSNVGMGLASAGENPVAAYLDMRGPITGLDYRAETPTNAVWKFAKLVSMCFRPTDANQVLQPAQWISGLRTPGTLVSDGWDGVFHIDSGENPRRTKEIIVDEPGFTGRIGGWGLNSVGGLTNLVFNCPKATSLSEPVSHSANGWKTDISDTWDLSSVKSVGTTSESTLVLGAGSYGPLSSPISGMTGTLRLPALVNIAAGPSDNASAFRCGISSAELGLNGNLASLACHSFKDCDKLTNVVLGTALGKTLTIWTNAFRCSSLKTVYFNGDKPVFKFPYNASSPAFGRASTVEGQITFYVRDVPSWADVLAEADANGGYVSGATLHTAQRQKVARFSGFSSSPTIEFQDPRFAAEYHETITTNATAQVSAGKGAWCAFVGPVTLTAAWADPDDAATDPRRAKFLRWDGVPLALERENPVTFMPDAATPVRAVFAHDWLMTTLADEPCPLIENGVWRVCCYKRTPLTDHYLGIGQGEKRVGKGQAWPTNKVNRIGGGDLNMNGDVWEQTGEDTWQKWTIVSSAPLVPWYYDGKPQQPARYVTEGEFDKLPTRVTYPESLLFYPGELYNIDTFDGGTANPVTEVFALFPHVTSGTVVSFTIGGVSQVARLVIRAPGVTCIGSDGPYGLSWSNSTFSRTNFDEWDLTGVTKITRNAFRCNTTFKAAGTLHLPNLRTVGTNAFHAASSFTGLVAGTNGLTLTSLGDTALRGANSLTNLVLGTKGLTVGANAFNCPKLAAVRFPGPALPAATVDAILASVPEASGAAKQTTIYASFYNGWGDLADACTADEAAVAPAGEEGLRGVYRAGSRKAWLVHARSIYDPHGSLFILR